MKHRMLLAALGTSALALAGCAQSTPVAGAPSPDQSVGSSARWTANIQSVTQSRGDVAQTTRDRSYGNIIWSRGDGPTLSTVSLTFTYAGQERYLSWALVAGSCGSPSLPLIPLANFPELNISGGGRGQVTSSLPIEFPTSGVYHVDIYKSRQADMASLVACGSLKLQG